MARPAADDPPGGTAALPAEVDELFTAPPADFITARDELAKHVKAGGDPELAKEIKALRRPTLAAWGVNQLAHREAARLSELFEITAALAEEQDRAVRGRGDAEQLRSLGQRHRAAINGLADTATAHLDALDASGAAQRDEIVAALERATTDPAVHDQVVAGRLSTIPEADPLSAFGGLLTSDAMRRAPAPAAARAKPRPARARKDARPTRAPAEERAERVLREHQDRVASFSNALAAAEADEADARRRLDELKTALDEARAEVAASAERTKEARKAEREARAALGRAERELERAQAAPGQ